MGWALISTHSTLPYYWNPTFIQPRRHGPTRFEFMSSSLHHLLPPPPFPRSSTSTTPLHCLTYSCQPYIYTLLQSLSTPHHPLLLHHSIVVTLHRSYRHPTLPPSTHHYRSTSTRFDPDPTPKSTSAMVGFRDPAQVNTSTPSKRQAERRYKKTAGPQPLLAAAAAAEAIAAANPQPVPTEPIVRDGTGWLRANILEPRGP